MLTASGVSCVCSDVPRSKSDRVRVENALCRSIRVTANGADDVRTVFWRTTAIAILLLDGEAITELMLERGIGVVKQPLYLYEVASEFFDFDDKEPG